MESGAFTVRKNQQHFRLGDLQLRIMRVLWDLETASVSKVHEALGGGLAYTTVATMLRKMEDRELVGHEEHDRRFIYRAAVSSDEVVQSMADNLVDRLFEGSLTDAIHHLLETREISHKELAQLERLIQERRKQKKL
jgi:BlaI family transcriptional regulator, penicillinase repressor